MSLGESPQKGEADDQRGGLDVSAPRQGRVSGGLVLAHIFASGYVASKPQGRSQDVIGCGYGCYEYSTPAGLS